MDLDSAYHIVNIACFFFFQAEDGIRDLTVTGVQTCALPISLLIIGAGEYVPIFPVASMRNSLQEHVTQETELNQQVAQLQVYERRYAEFKLEIGRASCRERV